MFRHVECKVYVGDLGNSASKAELENVFSYYGPLRNVWVARNPPGFAFVEFENPRDAEDAVRGLDGKTICGQRARVEMSNGRVYGRRPPPRWYQMPRPYEDRCYDCGDRGHYARDCSRRRRRTRSCSHRCTRSHSRSRSRSRSRPRSCSRSPRSAARSRSASSSRSQCRKKSTKSLSRSQSTSESEKINQFDATTTYGFDCSNN